MSEEIPIIPKITCGTPTLDEIKYYFLFKPKPVVNLSSRVFEQQESESSPELSDSFKEELENLSKQREANKKQNETIPTSDDDVFEDAAEEVPSHENYPLIEKTLCDIDDSQPVFSLRVRDSLLMNYERSSMNVTKNRPHYLPGTPNKSGVSFNFLNSSFNFPPIHSSAVKKEPASPMGNFLSYAQSLSMNAENTRDQSKTPVKKNDKFSHVKSPIAEYIKGTRSPQTVTAKRNLEVPSPRYNFRDSDIGMENESEGMVQSLPNRKLLRGTNVVKIQKERLFIRVRIHQVVEPKPCGDFMDNSYDSQDEGNEGSEDEFDEYEGVGDLFRFYSDESGFEENLDGVKELFE